MFSLFFDEEVTLGHHGDDCAYFFLEKNTNHALLVTFFSKFCYLFARASNLDSTVGW